MGAVGDDLADVGADERLAVAGEAASEVVVATITRYGADGYSVGTSYEALPGRLPRGAQPREPPRAVLAVEFGGRRLGRQLVEQVEEVRVVLTVDGLASCCMAGRLPRSGFV
ncbi:hypothetical protein ABZ508_26285 [Streptomyces lavendulocolor]|uniref:Uncharacterized protein n=1 Tax=Streptomyces lavendulocolor TaxID=67316 RepID=A0ABV2WC22_9ACTN